MTDHDPLRALVEEWREHAKRQRELIARNQCVNPITVSGQADATEERADELAALLSASASEPQEKNDDQARQFTASEAPGMGIAAIPDGLSARWQDIETAPKGRDLLVYRPSAPPRDRIAVRRVSDWCGPSCCPSAEPTHWMPLPEPPQTLNAEAPPVESASPVGAQNLSSFVVSPSDERGGERPDPIQDYLLVNNLRSIAAFLRKGDDCPPDSDCSWQKAGAICELAAERLSTPGSPAEGANAALELAVSELGARQKQIAELTEHVHGPRYGNGDVGGERCAECEQLRQTLRQEAGYYAYGDPERCRKHERVEDGGTFQWGCHKQAGHRGACSDHNDCGEISTGGEVCGLHPDHEGLHAWDRKNAVQTFTVVSTPAALGAPQHEEIRRAADPSDAVGHGDLREKPQPKGSQR
jgi:hypothetical protein